MDRSNQKPSGPNNRNRFDYSKLREDILKAIPEPVAFIDSSYRYVFVNEAYCKYFKKSVEEITGLSAEELTGVEYFKKIKPYLDRCLNGEELTYESKIQLGAAGDFYVRVDLKPHHNEKGEIDGLISSSKDITGLLRAQQALQESEIKFRQLAENIHQVFWLTDWTNKKLLYVSPTYESVFGLKREDAYRDPTGWRKVVHPDDLSGVNETFASDFSEQDIIEVEYRIITEDGSIKWIHDRSYPVPDSNGRIYRMVSLAEDITQRKKAEQALRESEKQLRAANAAKDKFFSIIAHDLRSPFNSIMGYTELLLLKSRRGETDDVFRISSILNDVAGQSYDLLNNLLEWSRAQTGSLKFVPSNFSVSEMIREQMESSRISAEQKGVKLIDRTEDVQVNADENMIRTIIRNLLSNAIKFTGMGGEVVVSSTLIGDFVEVSVVDTGVGVSKENLKKLFNYGEGFSRTGTNKEKGSGLGLLLCKEFVEIHGGTIEVESEGGRGSTFKFSIPVKHSK